MLLLGRAARLKAYAGAARRKRRGTAPPTSLRKKGREGYSNRDGTATSARAPPLADQGLAGPDAGVRAASGGRLRSARSRRAPAGTSRPCLRRAGTGGILGMVPPPGTIRAPD